MTKKFKTIIALGICLLFAISSQAQTLSNNDFFNIQQSYEIYNVNDYGIQNITPSTTIENNNFGGLNIYEHNDYGLKNIMPSQSIEQNSFGNIEIYNHNSYGIKNITPTQVIKPSDNNTYPTYNNYSSNYFKTIR